MKQNRSAITEATLALIIAAGTVMAITFTVILLLPAPEPQAVNVSDVAEAYANPNALSELDLYQYSTPTEPIYSINDELTRIQLLELTLASKLAITPEDVRVYVPEMATFSEDGMRIGMSEGGLSAVMEQISTSELPDTELMSNVRVIQLDEELSNNFVSTLADLDVFSLEVVAIKKAEHEWIVFKRKYSFWTGWRLQVFFAIGLSTIALIPIAWVAGNRLSQPLRDLAILADGSQLGEALPAVSIGGVQEIRSAADALFNMHRRLRIDAAQRTRVVAALAHDLRTPLTSLRVRIETAVSEEARAKMAYDIIRMEQMIQDMLLYAKGVDKAPDMTQLNLQTIISSCLDDVRNQVAVVRSGLLDPVWIRGHEMSIQRVINNLLVNAIQYGNNVCLNVELKSKNVVITISNDGDCLPERDLVRLLEPFERGEQSRNRDTGGTGLGLSIADEIMQVHQGSLVLKNRKVHGADDGIDAVLEIPLSKPTV